MRLVTACLSALALASLCGVAAADPAHVDPKPWHLDYGWIRSEYPESEPNNTCPGQSMSCGDVITPAYLTAGEQDWYRFYANAGDQLTLGTDIVNAGDNTDTYIELYFECGGGMLVGDDDSGPGFYSLISNYIAPSTGYYDLKVRGYNGSSAGPYKFFVNCSTPPPPPSNDVCANAIPIDRCTAGSLQGDTFLARNDYDPGSGGCASGYAEAGKDVVYLLNLVAGDVVDLTYTQLNYDTAFYIVTDCGNVAGSCVVGADDTFSGEAETIYWVVGSTGTYYLILDSYGSNSGGPWTLDYNISCPVQAEGACCFADGSCAIMTREGCNGEGGTYQGDNTDCDPNPCQAVATESSTWGAIKAQYR